MYMVCLVRLRGFNYCQWKCYCKFYTNNMSMLFYLQMLTGSLHERSVCWKEANFWRLILILPSCPLALLIFLFSFFVVVFVQHRNTLDLDIDHTLQKTTIWFSFRNVAGTSEITSTLLSIRGRHKNSNFYLTLWTILSILLNDLFNPITFVCLGECLCVREGEGASQLSFYSKEFFHLRKKIIIHTHTYEKGRQKEA